MADSTHRVYGVTVAWLGSSALTKDDVFPVWVVCGQMEFCKIELVFVLRFFDLPSVNLRIQRHVQQDGMFM